MLEKEQWNGFEGRLWKEEINVRDFIQKNYTQYDGNEEFLEGPTEATDKKKELKAEFLIWKQRLFQDLQLTALVILMNP